LDVQFAKNWFREKWTSPDTARGKPKGLEKFRYDILSNPRAELKKAGGQK